MNAMILLAHGARNDSWAQPFRAIRERASAMRPGTPVVLAYLEFMQPDLDAAFDRLAAQGATRIVVCPLFLGVGGHVARDVPRLVEAAHSRWPAIAVECTRTLGEDDGVLQAIADSCLRRLER